MRPRRGPGGRLPGAKAWSPALENPRARSTARSGAAVRRGLAMPELVSRARVGLDSARRPAVTTSRPISVPCQRRCAASPHLHCSATANTGRSRIKAATLAQRHARPRHARAFGGRAGRGSRRSSWRPTRCRAKAARSTSATPASSRRARARAVRRTRRRVAARDRRSRSFADSGRAERLRAEREALTDQLAAAVGLGGRERPRRFGDRARPRQRAAPHPRCDPQDRRARSGTRAPPRLDGAHRRVLRLRAARA